MGRGRADGDTAASPSPPHGRGPTSDGGSQSSSGGDTSPGLDGGGTPPAVAERQLKRLQIESEPPTPSLAGGSGGAERPQHTHSWARALVVFAGPGSRTDLPSQLRRRGWEVTAVDTKLGGWSHDLTRKKVADRLVSWVGGGGFDLVFIATPCASYSVAHRPQLRSRRSPGRVAGVRPEWDAYLAKHEKLAEVSVRLIEAAHAAGCAWALENPADRGNRDSKAWWPRYADHAPLWVQPRVADAIQAAGASVRTFAHCAFGAKEQKWTSIAHAAALDTVLCALDDRPCSHGTERHDAVAHGRFADGTSRSAASAAYPEAMDVFLGAAFTAHARGGIGRAAIEGGEEGRVAHGPSLGPNIASAIEVARATRPRFASTRNLRAATLADLRGESLPGELQALRARTRPRGALAGRRHRGTRPHADADACDSGAGGACAHVHAEDAGTRAARERRIADAPIDIADLFDGDDTYATEVLGWFDLADRAARRLARGEAAQRVPTRTIGQDRLQPWARGIVWDCRDPRACKPVERSTRDTAFPGVRQIDRAALRRAAEKLGWHDVDIVQQAGEGGIEARSACALDTVLAFHHRGLLDDAVAAAKVIRGDIAEEWVSPPVRDLPFVPCRVLPRNVVMQEKARVLHRHGPRQRGEAPLKPVIELYLKPRVTQDSSHGGDDSVNAGVPTAEREILLPTVQHFGRGIAICDTAGGDSARAQSYVVDAESAFRFCPMQQADCWTQCFVWWDDDGTSGVCVDRRLAFGGAFSPNRFERISTLAAAHVQAAQVAFDIAQPPPRSAALWAEERRALQRRGHLDPGHLQCRPAYLQVYIDDFTGAALDDAVTPPPSLATIVIDPGLMVSAGGTAARVASRVYVHAQLTVVGLAQLGLSASPGKVAVGDPVIALGFRVGRGRGRIDCPQLKQASMLHDIAAQTEAAGGATPSADQRRAETLVGRLVNLSQVFPELKSDLHGGYAVTESAWGRRTKRRGGKATLQLGRGSRAQEEWIALLGSADHLIDSNEGDALAPERHFRSTADPGVDTVTSDASGVDGVGGYVFDSSTPRTVWLVSETWPADIQRALSAAAEGEGQAEGISMPAAELFGSYAVAAAVAKARGRAPEAVVAVGDCAPAIGALNAASSGNAQMRSLVRAARRLSTQWLAVHVPRERNLDADLLSHPSEFARVEATARGGGVDTVLRARIDDGMWDHLRAAMRLGVGRAVAGQAALRPASRPPGKKAAGGIARA